MLLPVSGNIWLVDGETDAQVRRRVGAAIKLRREVLRLTQEDLAAAAAVSVRAVSGAETGERLPRGVNRRAYERGLRWRAGGIDEIIAGRAPVEIGPIEYLAVGAGGLDGDETDWPVGSSLDAAADAAGLSEAQRQRFIEQIRETKAPE